MLEPSHQALGVAEYLKLEAEARERHEYLDGHLYAMAGGTGRHNRIAGNIFARFWSLAQDKPCRVYQEGMKLRATERVFYYPDVMVVCGVPEPDPYFETEPCILVEVLSPSTQDIDLREKMLAYKALPSLEVYLIVEAERLAVRHLWRDEAGRWHEQDHAGDGDIPIPCLGGVLILPQIYRGVF